MRRILLCIITLIFFCFSGITQDFSNKGKDFWIPYPEHIDATNSTMGLYITSDVNTSGTIYVGATVIPFTVIANSVSPRFIGLTAPVISTNTNVYLGGFQDNVVSGKGIHVISDLPIVVFAHIIRSARSGATLVLPTNVWGKEYIMPSYANTSGNPAASNSYAQIDVFAEKANTVIEITPSIGTRNGAHIAGLPFQVTLPNIGDIYQLQFPINQDPSGTIVKSIASGTGGCNKIGVFSSTTWSSIGCANASGGDNLYQQLFPSGAWGKNFMTAPLKKVATVSTDNNNDIIRVFVKDPTTIVTKMDNGITTTLTGLTAGNFYEYSAFRPTYVVADKPVQVIQYIRSQTCGSPATVSDPEMIAVSALEQTINDITVFSAYQTNVPAGQSAVTTHYLNVIMKTANTASFKINGFAPSASFTPIIGTAYSFLKENVTTPVAPRPPGPVFRLQADSGFNAIAYGFGNFESYGYNAGTNVRDFNQSLEIQSPNGIITSGAYSCSGSPFRFNIYLPDSALSNSGATAGTNVLVRYDSMKWSISNSNNFIPNNFPVLVNGSVPYPPTYLNPIVPADSVNIRNGKFVAWYSLPTNYTITTPGTYIITVIGYKTNNNDGCSSGNETEFTFTLTVAGPPPATFTFSQPGCPADSVRFLETTPQFPYPTYRFWWSFYDPTNNSTVISTVRNPVHAFNTAGPKTIRFANITTPGCLSDTTTQTVIIPDLVNITLSGTTSVCQNATPQPNINFTISDGLPPYKINYTLSTNGGAPIAQTPIITSSLINPLAISTSTAGVYTYNITSVENAVASFCTRPTTGQSATISVNPIPTATITGTTTVCQGSPAPQITFTGANGLAPYTFSYNINGGATQTITTTTGNSVALPSSTATIGVTNYNLISVVDASSTLCTQAQSGTATITVQATSTATIGGSATVCQNATAPTITFTGANGTAPFTFQYNINGGATQTIVTTGASTSATVIVPMTATGTFVYNLTSVQSSGSIPCISAITGAAATVIINPVPTATIAGTITVCQASGPQPVTFTGAGGTTASYTFNYTLSTNGGAPVAQPAITGNNVIVNQPTTTFGTYTYSITSVSEIATGCTKTYTTGAPTAIITVNQLATATITTSAATVCQANTTLPVITFTALGGVAPYKFNYTVTTNGVTGAVQTTPFTPFGNSYQITLPTTTAGTYIYTLVSVQESSTNGNCVNPQTGSTQVIIHPKPTASFTAAGPYCEQKSVLITPTSGITPTGSITSWVWDYGDGVGSQIRTDGNPFTLTYPTAGVKIITFKTVSNNGCMSDVFTPTPPVTIFSKPKAGFVNPAACLADAQAQFSDTSTVAGGSIVFWEWDFGDGSPIYAGSTLAHKNPLHSYAAVGQKTVKLIVTSNNGCLADTTQQFFINGEVTRASFTTLNAANLCSNRPVQIQENSLVNVGGLIRTDIYWDYLGAPTVFNQDNTPTPNKIYTHSYPNLQTNQTYKVRYYAYSGFNGVCQKDTIIDVLVHASPVATFIAVPDVCLNGGPVVLNQGSAAGGVGVYTGPGVTNTGGIYTFNPLATGVTVGINPGVVYTVTSPAGCDSAKVQQIKVLAPPVVNTFTTVGNLCHNNAMTFHNTYTNGDGTVIKWIYNWNDGSPVQTMTTDADVTHVYTTTGAHSATLTLETDYGCRNVPFSTITFTVNPLPVPTYYTNTACLPNANITFTNTTANLTGNTYLWSFELPSTTGANTSTATATATHTYTSQGPFNTSLIATNTVTGCFDTSAIIVINADTIHAAPVVQFDVVPDICLNNGTVPLAGYASETSGIAGGPGIFTCVATPAAISANGTFNPAIAGVGPHVITYTWTSTFNCPTSITRTVNVLAPPVVTSFTTIGSKCETERVTFHNTVTQGAGTINTWIYSWGDGTPNSTFTNGNDVTHTYTLPGTYNATLSLITDGALCKSAPAFPLQVIVSPLPVPNFTYSDTACLPQAKVVFNNTTANINDWVYFWNFDLPSTLTSDLSTQPQPGSHTYFTQSPHNVQLIAVSSFTGCRDTFVNPITTIHPAPTASFNFNKTSVCLAQNVTVLDNSTFADGSPLKWSWNFGENNTNQLGQTQPPYTYTTANTFNVKLTVTNSFGCIDDTIRPFTVYPYPVIDAGPNDFILEGGTIPLAATATGNNLTYLWTATPAPSYLSDSTKLNPLARPVVDVKYKLTVTAQGGCFTSDSVFIKVLKFPEIPNTFTPNNDGVHDFWEIRYLFTYPANRVQVFTRTGQLVFESKGYTSPWNGTMNGKSLPFDTYYYIIEPGNGRKPITGYVTLIK